MKIKIFINYVNKSFINLNYVLTASKLDGTKNKKGESF